MPSRKSLLAIAMLLASGACTNNEPSYIDSPMKLEAFGTMDASGMLTGSAAQLTLPIKPESPSDMTARGQLATQLGLTMDLIPYIRVGDLDVEVEWTITNLDSAPGQVKIQLNGANEFFRFDPTVVVLAAPGDDEAPKTPPLAGDIPIDVPANGTVDGVFREDEVLEASIDLDAITRGNLNPFKAILSINKNDQSFEQLMPLVAPTMPGQMVTQPTGTLGPPIPRAAMAGMTEVDLVFTPDHHMTLDFTVRVRDHRGILADKGLAAVGKTCSGDGRGNSWPCAMMFMPTLFMP